MTSAAEALAASLDKAGIAPPQEVSPSDVAGFGDVLEEKLRAAGFTPKPIPPSKLEFARERMAPIERAAGNVANAAQGFSENLASLYASVPETAGMASQAIAGSPNTPEIVSRFMGKLGGLERGFAGKMREAAAVMPDSYYVEGQPLVEPGFGTSIAQGFGSAVGFIAGGEALAATGIARGLGIAGLGALVEGESMVREAEAAGANTEQKWLAWMIGAGAGATEAVGASSVLAPLDARMGGALLKRLAGSNLAVKMIAEGTEEGAQETVQQLIEDFGRQYVAQYGEDKTWSEIISDATEQGAPAWVVGALLGGAVDVAGIHKQKSDRKKAAKEVVSTIGDIGLEEASKAEGNGKDKDLTPYAAVEAFRADNLKAIDAKLKAAEGKIAAGDESGTWAEEKTRLEAAREAVASADTHVLGESEDPAEEKLSGTLELLRQSGADIPSVIMVDSAENLPIQGAQFGGQILLDASRTEQVLQGLLFHEAFHHAVPIGSPQMQELVGTAREQFPELTERLRALYMARLTDAGHGDAFAHLPTEERLAKEFEEAFAIGAELMPELIDNTLRDGMDAEKLRTQPGLRGMLARVIDYVFGALNKLGINIKTGRMKEVAAIREALLGPVQDFDGDQIADFVKAVSKAYSGLSEEQKASAAEEFGKSDWWASETPLLGEGQREEQGPLAGVASEDIQAAQAVDVDALEAEVAAEEAKPKKAKAPTPKVTVQEPMTPQKARDEMTPKQRQREARQRKRLRRQIDAAKAEGDTKKQQRLERKLGQIDPHRGARRVEPSKSQQAKDIAEFGSDEEAVGRFSIAPQTQLGFYSNTEEAFEKMVAKSGAKKIRSDILVQRVLAAGGNKEEIAWMGLADWAKEHPEKRIPVEEVREFMRENGIVVGEKLLGVDAKHATYQLPGGENYRELLLTLPDKGGAWNIEDRDTGEVLESHLWRAQAEHRIEPLEREYTGINLRIAQEAPRANYDHGHYGDTPNVLAHVRFNERTGPNGERVLFIEEVQSDWHQAGREKGYAGISADALEAEYKVDLEAFYSGKGSKSEAEWTRLSERVREYDERESKRRKGVPEAPFKTAWEKLSFRRMVRWAAENGFDTVAWTTGVQQVERYETEMRQKIESIEWRPGNEELTSVVVQPVSGSTMTFEVDGEGIVKDASVNGAVDKHAAELFGKSIAARVIAEPSGKIEGDDLTIGGEGMKAAYDQRLVGIANKLGKQFGAKVGSISIDAGDGFRVEKYGDIYRLTENGVVKATFSTAEEAWAKAEEMGGAPVHALPVTEKMRDSVMQGQAMYSIAPTEGEAFQDDGAQREAKMLRVVNEHGVEVVPVIYAPSEEKRGLEKRTDGQMVLHASGVFANDLGSLRRVLFREVDKLLSSLPAGVFVRTTNRKEDYEHLSNGTHHGSTDWSSGGFETGHEVIKEGGLSVALRLETPADYAYLVSGTVVGEGTDGEPLLDSSTAKPVSRLMSHTDMVKHLAKGRKTRLREIGLSEDDARALAVQPYLKLVDASDPDIRRSVEATYAHSELRKRGFTLERNRGGSAYFQRGGLSVRVSDHDVPMTPEREHAAANGGFTWADSGWNLVLDADTDNAEIDEFLARLDSEHPAPPQATGQVRKAAKRLVRELRESGSKWILLEGSETPWFESQYILDRANAWKQLLDDGSPNALFRAIEHTLSNPEAANQKLDIRRSVAGDEHETIAFNRGWGAEAESWLADSLIHVRKLQKSLYVPEGADWDEREVRSKGKLMRDVDKFDAEFVQPMVEAMNAGDISIDEAHLYLAALHSLERNATLIGRDAALAKQWQKYEARKAELDIWSKKKTAFDKWNREKADGVKKRTARPENPGRKPAKIAKPRSKPKGWSTEKKPGAWLAKSEAERVISDMMARPNAKRFRRLRRLNRKMHEWKLNLIEEAGLEPPEVIAKIKALGWKDYVPMVSVMKGRRAIGRPKGYSVGGKDVRRMGGRRSEPDNVMVAGITDVLSALERREKNEVMNTFAKLVEANPDPGLWETVEASLADVKMTSQEDLEAGVEPNVFRALWDARIDKRDAAVGFKRDGKQHFIVFHPRGKHLAEALDGSNMVDLRGILGPFSKINRYYAAANTSWSLNFIVDNFRRDSLLGGLRIALELSTKDAAKVLGATPSSIRDMYRGTGADVEAYLDSGAKTGFFFGGDSAAQRKSLEKRLRRAQDAKGIVDRTARGFSAVAGLVHDVNDAVENGIRFSYWKHLVETGSTHEEAAVKAKELTINFSKKGRLAPAFGPLYLFFNAAMRGNVVVRDMVKKNPGKVLGGLMAFGAFTDLLNYMLSGDDDDGENAWDALPEYERDRYLMIPDGNGGFIRLWAQPYGLNAIVSVGRNFSRMLRGAISPGEALGASLTSALDSFNPLGSSGGEADSALVHMLTPTALDPLADIALNDNFAGNPIYRDKMPGENKPDSELGRKGTPDFWKAMASGLNSLTGGDRLKSGGVDPHPETLRHLWKQVGGGIWRDATHMADSFQSLGSGELMEAFDLFPITSKFHSSEYDYKWRSSYYENVTAIDAAQDRVRARDIEATPEEVALARLAPARKAIMALTRKVQKAISATDNDERAEELMVTLRDRVREFNRATARARKEAPQ